MAKRKKKGFISVDGLEPLALSAPVHVNTGAILGADSDNLYEEIILVGGAACDWLTLTTSSSEQYMAMQGYTIAPDSVRRMPVREASRMQYRGYSGDGWFVGEGIQEGEPHYMLQAWGARAHDVLRYALMFHVKHGEVKCTRIDIQSTSEVGHAGDLPAVAEAIRECPSHQWGSRGPRPKVTYFSSEDERDTMYIGSRRAARMWRFYNKVINGELRLRVELEGKNWLAGAIWEKLQEHGELYITSVLADEFATLPQDARSVADICQIGLMAGSRLPKPVLDRDALRATQRWLMEVVLPCFQRIMETEVGQEVREAYRRVGRFDSQE